MASVGRMRGRASFEPGETMLNALQEQESVVERASARAQKLQNCRQCPIRNESVCAALDLCELVALEKMGHKVTLPPRSRIFMEGDGAESVFNVTSGFVRIHRLSANGRCQVVGFALPGDFLGLPVQEHYGVSADAAVATTVCRFPRPAFLAFVQDHPRLLSRLHEAAMLALHRAHDQMMLLGPGRAEVKVAAFLLTMNRRWARLRGESDLIALPLRRQDIGDYLGLTIATVSRTLQRMSRQQVIRIVRQGVQVLDRGRLEELSLA